VSLHDWPLRPLGEVVRFLSGGTPNKSRPEYWNGDIPWVSSGEMTERRIHDTSLHVSVEGASEGSRIVPTNTVLAVVRGMSLAKEFRVAITKRDMAFNQDLKALIPKGGLDSEFLFYSLLAQREKVRELATEASHGTKRLETDVLSGVRIGIPRDMAIQRRIVDILSMYDDLIANNERRISLLDRGAHEIYVEWFARLQFPGFAGTPIVDGVPEGWRRGSLRECATLKYGKALKTEERQIGNVPVLGSSGVIGTHARALVPGPGIIVGRKGNVGSVYWSSIGYWPIDTVFYVGADQSTLWLYHALRELTFNNTDVAVPGLNRDNAYSRTLLLPETGLVNQFQDVVTPLQDQTDQLVQMNTKLEIARDLMLRRLMSGEIPV
jgi:type I restriction enzyme S subunit